MALNPQGKWLTTELPEIVFEDTKVGRMKKRIWDAPMEEIDRIYQEVTRGMEEDRSCA